MKLKCLDKWKQNWYADDSASLAKFQFLKEWLDILIQESRIFGYFPEQNKSYIVVNPDFIDEATTIFGEMGIQIVTGRKFLGGFIGGSEDVIAWMEEKVKGWVSSVYKLAKFVKRQPQAAFIAFTKSLQAEWAYFQ